MTHAETIHRVWTLFGLFVLFFGLTVLQLWSGKSILKGPKIISRKKEPFMFWFNVAVTTAAALICAFGIGRT